MKKMKAVVFRINGDKTAVYTHKGDFREIPTPKKPPCVGQMIEIDVKPANWSIKHAFLKYSIASAVLILILTLGLLNPFVSPNAAVASVALDVNYGLELYVNKQSRVVDVRNVSGQFDEMLKNLDLKNKDIYEAVNLILTEAKTKGVLKEEKNLVLASVIPIEDAGQNLINDEKLRGVIRNAMVSNNISGIFMIGKTDKEIKAQAEGLNLTVNRYQIYERCRQDGQKIHADDFRSEKIQQTLENNNVYLTELFPNNCFEIPPKNYAGLQSKAGILPENSTNHNNRDEKHSSSVSDANMPKEEHHMEDNHYNSNTTYIQSNPAAEQDHSSGWGTHEGMMDGGDH